MLPKKEPKVSVLIPTYNYAHHLPEAIESVLAQTFSDYELIVVDDHSSDNTSEIMHRYAHHEQITFYKNEKNLGLVGNWNRCLNYASGTYIKFLMADDYFHPRLLEEMVRIMETNPAVSLVTCYKAEVGSRSRRWAMPFQGLQSGNMILRHTLHHYGWLGEPTTVMFRSANLKAGLFNPAYTWLPDWEMWLRQLALGDCYILPEVLVFIRNHSGQVTKKVMNNYTNYFEEYHLIQAISQNKEYAFDTNGLDMNALVKQKAAKCAGILYKTITRLHKKKYRMLFKQAFRIAWTESVLLDPIWKMMQNEPEKRGTVLKELSPG